MDGNIYFEIQVEDAVRARTFYGEVFGWTFEFAPGLPVPYWRIETGGGRGGLLERPAKPPPAEWGTNAFVCSFEVKDLDDSRGEVDAMIRKAEEAGGSIPGDPVDHGWMYHWAFLDLDGHRWEPLYQDERGGK